VREDRPVDLATLDELLSPDGQRLLDEVRQRSATESDLALGTRLRRHHDAAVVAAAIGQHHLRRQAHGKLGPDADRMWFTPDGLQQATRAAVAAHRARRLVTAGLRSMLDLGCGIGGDLVMAARAGLAVSGVDLDPVRVRMAGANLAALGLAGEVRVADATTVERTADVSFVDPARRDGRGRRFDPRACTPGWDFVTGLLEGSAAAKVAPGIAHDLVPAGVEAEWVSDGGDLVEACLWGRPLATAGRRVTLLPAGATLTDVDAPEGRPLGPVGRWLYEPDDAVGRAGLVTSVARDVDGWLLDEYLAYVCGDRLVHTPFATAYTVLEELPYREKQLRAALRERGVGTLTIKRRGVDVVPETLRRRLGLRGDRAATIVLTRVAGEGRALLVERVPAPDVQPGASPDASAGHDTG
jgi:SAM-dependent methyltransferase